MRTMRPFLFVVLLCMLFCPFLNSCAPALSEFPSEESGETARQDGTEETAGTQEAKPQGDNKQDEKVEKDPSKDDELNIIFIGNSYSYYWVDEFWSMLHAAGYEKLTVCNVYYSGCTLEQHVNWMMENQANYEFCIYTEKGKNVKKNSSLKTCLSWADWDMVGIQQSGTYLYGKGEDALRKSLEKDLGTLLAYVKRTHPNAKYFWQQGWVHGLGKEYDTVEEQMRYTDINRRVAQDTCAAYNLTCVPLGDAWESVRHDPLIHEGGKTLTTRIFQGKPDHDDLSHDGDVGGGQFLNACVYYEVLTQKSCLDNTFRPHYEYQGQDLSLSAEKIALLKNAAHSAVAAVYGEDFAK